MKKLFLFFAALLVGSTMVVQATTYKIYINDQTGWSNGRGLYSWGGSSDLGSWPGSTTYSSENVGGVDYIVFTVNDGVITSNLIFNNANNGKQHDLPARSAAQDYFYNATSSGISEVGAPVSNPVVRLRGDFNGWGDTDVFTDNGATATFTKTISADTYGMKITVGSDWKNNATTIQRANSGTEYDFSGNEGSNCSLVADINGEYTFTYTFATQKLSVTFPSEPVVLPPATITAKGSWDGWANNLTFDIAANEETASVTKNLSNTNYSFKVLVNGDWRANGKTFARDDNSTSGLTSNGDDMTINADIAGDYTFTWTYADNSLEITYPDPAAPAVSFDGLPTNVYYGQSVTFAATSENVTNPTYTYYVKKGTGAYGSAVASYTFNDEGDYPSSYTVKVEVRENGAGDAKATAEASITCYKYSLMQNDHSNNDKGSEVAVCSTTNGSVFTATWTCPAIGEYYFYVTKNTSSDAHTNCDYLNGNQTFEDGVAKTAYLYGDANGCYGHSYKLDAPRTGEYTFTLTIGDGNTFQCDYPIALVPEVYLNTLPEVAYKNDILTFADYVTSVNVTQPEYTFYIKQKEGGSYGVAVTSKTFNDDVVYPCIYTVKAEVREEGAGGAALDEIEQDITIYEPITLYFVNKSAWSDLHAYAYLSTNTDIKNHDWAGEPMTDTDVDSNHGYDVYSITLPAGRYNTVIFNVGNSSSQTDNLSINAATPYYCDGAWFATLDAADPLNLASDFYLVGNIMGWDPTETYRFMKATEDATVASTTLTLNEYSNIDFKLKEGDAWRGAVDANVVLYHDYNTVQITENADGNNIGLTPYAAGDYVFTLNLSTRELTVTYPDGDPMPIPTNIFLAGTMNSWAPDNADYKFTVDNDLATLAVTLDAETDYQFKLVYNGSWYGANYNFNYYWNTDVDMVHEGDASHLFTFKAGTYTFEYNTSTGKLSVRFQATTATSIAVSSYEYATLYSATGFDVPNEVEAYIVTGIDGIHLTKERIYRIPANTGVILHAPEGSYDFYEGDSRYMGVDVSSNMLKGTTADQDIENELVHYVLSYDTDDNVGLFWPYGTGANQGVGLFNNKAGKAYLEIPAQAQSQGVIARRGFPFFPVADMPTGIESQELKVESGKMILNGQLLIIRDGRIFNAQGARVK